MGIVCGLLKESAVPGKLGLSLLQDTMMIGCAHRENHELSFSVITAGIAGLFDCAFNRDRSCEALDQMSIRGGYHGSLKLVCSFGGEVPGP